MNKVELGQTVLEPSVSLSIIIPQILHIIRLLIWGLIVAPLDTAVPQRHVTPHYKKSNIESVVITFISFFIFAS